MIFKFQARVARADRAAIEQALAALGAEFTLAQPCEDFTIEGEVEGESAKDLNRRLLSALRKTQKRATLRAQWRSSGNLVESYFDYVLKKTTRDTSA